MVIGAGLPGSPGWPPADGRGRLTEGLLDPELGTALGIAAGADVCGQGDALVEDLSLDVVPGNDHGNETPGARIEKRHLGIGGIAVKKLVGHVRRGGGNAPGREREEART